MAELTPRTSQSGLLQAERAKATFAVDRMTSAFYGGDENVARRRFIIGPIEDVGVERYEWTRGEGMARSVKHFIDIHKEFTTRKFKTQPFDTNYMSENATLSGPLMTTFGLGLPTVIGQASPEQAMVWLPKIFSFQMVLPYCQTELGHGSNLRGILTTATFDEATGDFDLHTPCLEALKWWNSGAGAVATHGVVVAKLIIRGKNYGNHFFFVQLRDENHNLLPGIEAGDHGPKLADDFIDSGYIRFTHVRVPREHLFAKRQHVERDGTYVRHESGKAEGTQFATYTSMMNARAGMVSMCSGRLAQGAVIAARYSCCLLYTSPSPRD